MVKLVRCCPTTTLANRNKYLVIIMFKSHVNDLQVQVKYRVSSLKSKSIRSKDAGIERRIVTI